MATEHYNPRRVLFTWEARLTPNSDPIHIVFRHPMDGEFADAEYDEQRVTKHIGAQGEYSYVLNANEGAKLTYKFAQGSPTLDDLAPLLPDVGRDLLARGPLTGIDQRTQQRVFFSPDAVLATPGKLTYGDKITGREYEFECGKAQIVPTGAGEI